MNKPDKKELFCSALRQLKHNDGSDGFVCAYDIDEVYKIVDENYTRTPTAKRFDDELPKEGELIMWKSKDTEKWFQLNWKDVFKGSSLDQCIWFPVILPKEDV